MCYYVTVAIPKETDLETLQPIWVQHQMAFGPVHNRRFQQLLPAGCRYGRLTRTHCDCDTAVGAAARVAEHVAKDEARIEQHLAAVRRKGWSAAKIERWLTGKRGSVHQQEAALSASQDSRRWRAVLRDVLGSGHCARLGVLLHFYNGTLEDEKIRLQGAVEVRLAAGTPTFITELRTDMLYWFVP